MGLFGKARPPLPPAPPQKPLATSPVSPEDVCRRKCREALLWERYLYEDHTRKQLADWARRLKYFRFCRAYGGHAGDGDQLIALLHTPDEPTLLATCATLGLPLQPMPSEAEAATVPLGDRPSSSRHFPHWQQPKRVEIDGARLFCWVTSHAPKGPDGKPTGQALPALQFSLSDRDNVWAVTESTVREAELLETRLAALAAQLIDPPQDDRNCLCPKHYPEMFGLWYRATAQWPWDEPDPH